MKFLVLSIDIIKYVGDKGKFGKLLAPGQIRKAWEISRDHDMQTRNRLEKDNKLKERIIEELKEEVKEFEQQKFQFLKSEEKLAKLYTVGLIDSNGDVIPVTPLDDSDEMK